LVCLDTDLIIGILRGDETAKEVVSRLEQKNEEISTTVITVYELLKGALASANPEKAQLSVRGLLSRTRLLTLTEEASSRAAILFTELQKKGTAIGELDILIAAICISNQETLLTRDEHFSRIQAIDLRRW